MHTDSGDARKRYRTLAALTVAALALTGVLIYGLSARTESEQRAVQTSTKGPTTGPTEHQQEALPKGEESPVAAPKQLPTLPASDLLVRANQEQAAGHWEEAEAYYRNVARRYPLSEQAYPALVAEGDIALHQRNDPKRALSSYVRAAQLWPKGALHERVLVGIGTSARATGDLVVEASAWRQLLERFPESRSRAQAQRRLEQLAALVARQRAAQEAQPAHKAAGTPQPGGI